MLPPQPTITAHAVFFHGALSAKATLSAMNVKFDGSREGKPSRPGHGGGPGGGMGPPPGGPGMGGPPPGGVMGPGGDGPPPMGGMGAPPRMTLSISLANEGTEPLKIYVTDVISALGNFAVRPEFLELAPGQQGSLDPFGVSFPENLSELSVEVRIRRGAERETQTLHLVPENLKPTPNR